jgi:uncharacterized membrane protein YhaH (DUF805 family)
MNYFLDAFKQYATFTGRATRTQYWMFVLFYVIFYVVLSIIDNVLGTMILALIFSLALLIPSISIAARRLHDTGRSGWWQLIVLIPVIGFIVLIVFLVLESQGDNEYGAAPQAS